MYQHVEPEEEVETTDAGKQRMKKIERLKFKKTLDAKVAYMLQRKKELCGEEYNWGAAGGLDEEMEREFILALLQRQGIEAIDGVRMAEMELPLLETHIGIKEGTRDPPKAEPAGKPWVVKIKDPADLRKMYMDQVFQPDILMPTIPLSVAIDSEMKEALELAERQNRPKPELTEDEELMRQRDWDDWKDENPKGSGNKMNNVS
eukprot:GEMP01082728.1.p1 GENE.GEMP01082728.1~~GEMP01082728.1.p1  ORF type:complete len:204 (+),score=67.03 GEMP01082728.1:409-1020(+)